MYRSQAVTVFDFNFFHATPAFSVLPKPDDGEPYKGHERMRVSRSSISWRSFLSGSFLENWQIFPIIKLHAPIAALRNLQCGFERAGDKGSLLL